MVTFFNRKKKKLNVRQNRNWQDKERRFGINKNATMHHVGYDHGGKAENQEEKVQSQKCCRITKFLQYRLYQDDEQNREQKVHQT